MLPAFHFRYQNEYEEFFFRWASQNIQYQIPAAANERSKRLTPYGNGTEPIVHVKLLPQMCSEVQSLLGNFVTLQKIWILNFLQCTEFQHWLSQQNECLLAFSPCWMQALNPMNQKCCDCLVTWEKRADIIRILLLSKAMFWGVSVPAKLHWPLFSLEVDVVDRSQIKLLTQACGVLVQDWSCARNAWSWYLSA